MKIDINSWHYKLIKDYLHYGATIPSNLCPYMRILFYAVFRDFFKAAAIVFIISFFGSILLDPIISMIGFWTANGFATGYLPKTTYALEFLIRVGELIFAPFGATVPQIAGLPAVATADFTFMSYLIWFGETFPSTTMLLVIASVSIVLILSASLGSFLFNKIHYFKRVKIQRMEIRIKDDGPLDFTTLVYKRIRAYKDKVCPTIEFVSPDEEEKK